MPEAKSGEGEESGVAGPIFMGAILICGEGANIIKLRCGLQPGLNIWL